MQVNPYLFYNGNCEEALKYYRKCWAPGSRRCILYEGGPPKCRSRRTGRRS